MEQPTRFERLPVGAFFRQLGFHELLGLESTREQRRGPGRNIWRKTDENHSEPVLVRWRGWTNFHWELSGWFIDEDTLEPLPGLGGWMRYTWTPKNMRRVEVWETSPDAVRAAFKAWLADEALDADRWAYAALRALPECEYEGMFTMPREDRRRQDEANQAIISQRLAIRQRWRELQNEERARRRQG
jgi:hypothetical protein